MVALDIEFGMAVPAGLRARVRVSLGDSDDSGAGSGSRRGGVSRVYHALLDS